MLSNTNLRSPPSLDAFMIDRALGALIGLAIGDAVGTTTEDLPPDPIRIHSDPDEGQLTPRLVRWTAPTAMALALADTLCDPAGYSSDGFMTRLVQWLNTGRFACQGRCVAIGRSTRAAVRRFITTGLATHAPDPTASAGSGSLTRLAPIALRHLHQPDLAEQTARQQSFCTHSAPEAADAAVYFVTLLRELILDVTNATMPRALPLLAHPRIAQVAAGSYLRLPRPRPTGQVADTLELALWALHHTEDFEQAVTVATSLGGAASATGAVTGMLAGASFGLSAIPRRWRNRLSWRNQLRDVGLQLLEAGSC